MWKYRLKVNSSKEVLDSKYNNWFWIITKPIIVFDIFFCRKWVARETWKGSIFGKLDNQATKPP